MGKHGLDPRSDQYALAVVGYQMLSGRVPFEGENVREVLAKQMFEEAVPLSRLVADVPVELSRTIHQALQKDPAHRFASMNAFARSLEGKEVSPAEGGRVRRSSRFNIRVEQRRWIAAGAWVVLLGGIAIGAGRAGLLGSSAAPPPPPPEAADSRPAIVPPARQHMARAPASARQTPPVQGRSDSVPATVVAAPAESCQSAMQAQHWEVAFARCSAEADSSSGARRNLGLLYAEGHGTERNERLASVHLGFAAQDAAAPDTQAVVLMAKRYDSGLGVAVDRSKAAGLWEVAASMGVKEAFPVIAARYADGDGRRKNDSAAAVWYRKAAESGHAGSMTQLAESYARGRGLKRDETQSRTWYSKAAELHEPEAEYQLALMLLKGKGGFQRDDVAGMQWLERAAKDGHLEAQHELARRRGAG